jgi:hypothetical protein
MYFSNYSVEKTCQIQTLQAFGIKDDDILCNYF